jgi:TolB-like protein
MLSASDTGRTSLLDPPLWESRGSGTPLTALPKSFSANGLASRRGSENAPDTEGEKPLIAAGLSLNNAKGTPPPNNVVMEQLDRVLQSKTFVQSEKLSRFLRFVVEHVIYGNPECLKEYLVGVEVYGRKPPYDPSQDSIVRTEARRLRNKLKEYYGGEGKEDPVFIYLRPGSYIPAFQSREDLAGTPNSIVPDTAPLPDSSSIVTAIMPFTDISGSPESARYARGIPDELAYRLTEKDGCTVISTFSTAYFRAQGLDIAAAMKRVRARIAFEGSARIEGTTLRVTARIVDAIGVPLWIERLNVELGTKTSFAIEESIAKALSAGFDVVQANRALTQRVLP